jgi:hypothetical protein
MNVHTQGGQLTHYYGMIIRGIQNSIGWQKVAPVSIFLSLLVRWLVTTTSLLPINSLNNLPY